MSVCSMIADMNEEGLWLNWWGYSTHLDDH